MANSSVTGQCASPRLSGAQPVASRIGDSAQQLGGSNLEPQPAASSSAMGDSKTSLASGGTSAQGPDVVRADIPVR